MAVPPQELHTPWHGDVGETAGKPVQVKQLRVQCGTCRQIFKLDLIPPVTVQLDPATPPPGPISGKGTALVPQHVIEPFWRCVGSGVESAVLAEAGSTWPLP